jgi:hypothetical protein
MSKVGSHDPFGQLKYKLWPKERLEVKLAIRLPTIKSWESSWFPFVKVACYISLERSRRGLQLCFGPHFNRRFVDKVIGPQNRGSPNFGNFAGQNVIWMWASWKGTEYTIRGKVLASPKFGLWWVLWVWVCPLTPKVLQLCTNQLVVYFSASPCEWLSACHSF